MTAAVLLHESEYSKCICLQGCKLCVFCKILEIYTRLSAHVDEVKCLNRVFPEVKIF